MGALLTLDDNHTDNCSKTCCLDPKRPLADHETQLLDELAQQGNALKAGVAPDEARKHILNTKYPHFAHFKAYTPTAVTEKTLSPASSYYSIVPRGRLHSGTPVTRFVAYSASDVGCTPTTSSSVASYVSAWSTCNYRAGAPGQAPSPPPAPLRKTSFGPLPIPDQTIPARRPATPFVPKQMRYYRHHKSPIGEDGTHSSNPISTGPLGSIVEPNDKQKPSVLRPGPPALRISSPPNEASQTAQISPRRYLISILSPLYSPLTSPAPTTMSRQYALELPPTSLLPASPSFLFPPQSWFRLYQTHERTPWAHPLLSPTKACNRPSTSTSLPSPLIGPLSRTALLSLKSPLSPRAFPPGSFFRRASDRPRPNPKAHTDPTPIGSKKLRRRIFRSALLWPIMLPMKIYIRQSLKRSEKPGGKHELGYGKICHCMDGFEQIVDAEAGMESGVRSRRVSVQMVGKELERKLEQVVGIDPREREYSAKKDGKWRFKDLGWT